MPASPIHNFPGAGRAAAGVSQQTANYRIFDLLIESQIPLPELPTCTEGQARVAIERLELGEIETQRYTACHDWKDDDGHLMCRVSRCEAGYLLSLPGQATFKIGSNGVISCGVAPGAEPGLVRQLLLSQVLPRYLAHAGELMLHASAVTLPNGATVAFLGETGQGKSTLASYCQQQSAQFIDDDCVQLRCDRSGVSITGGVPTIRLYPDSLLALGHDPDDFVTYSQRSQKRQMRLPDRSLPESEPRALDALILLGAAHGLPAAEAPHLEPALGQSAMMAMLRSAFYLDPSDRLAMQRNFQRVAQALNRGLPVYHLHYPREHHMLPRVLQCLLQICTSSEPTGNTHESS